MCWKSSKLNEQISDGNVEVFKICLTGENNNICSYFFNDFKYQLNKKYETIIKVGRTAIHPYATDLYRGDNGFHSYSASCSMEKIGIYSGFFKPVFHPRIAIYSSKHIYLYTYEAPLRTMVTVKGYIPKGAKYYINGNDEIISEAIVLTEIQETFSPSNNK